MGNFMPYLSYNNFVYIKYNNYNSYNPETWWTMSVI